MEKIAVAIIGLGRIASLLEDDTLREKPCTHAGAFAGNPDCILVAGCDTNSRRRELFAAKYNVQVYAEAKEMLTRHKCGILCIATHPDSHEFYAKLGAAFGVSVIVCEKPLADSLRAARKIVALTKRASKKVCIITNHERRYSADYIKAKEILDGGSLGKVLSVRAMLYMGSNMSHRDVLWHDGTHLVDAISFLTGSKLIHKNSFCSKLNGKTGTAYLEGKLRKTGCSVPCLIEVGAGRDHLVFEIEVSCAKGRLRIGNGIFEVWESAPCSYAENFRSLSKTQSSFGGTTGYFSNMARDAVRCVRALSAVPVSGAKDALAVIEYLDSLQRGSAQLKKMQL